MDLENMNAMEVIEMVTGKRDLQEALAVIRARIRATYGMPYCRDWAVREGVLPANAIEDGEYVFDDEDVLGSLVGIYLLDEARSGRIKVQ